jgi:hypothetical protein
MEARRRRSGQNKLDGENRHSPIEAEIIAAI